MTTRRNRWIRLGIPLAVLIVIILAAVLGGVLGSRAHHNNSRSSSQSAASASAAASSSAAAANSAKAELGIYPISTDSQWMVPIYPSTTNPAAFSTPTFLPASASAVNAWPTDTFSPSSPAPTSVRTDRPRLIAPAYKWAALPSLISADPYLKSWNDTIFRNVSQYMTLPPVVYHLDNSSGILDNSREVKMRIKAFAYVYRFTNDSSVLDRAWSEVSNVFSSSFGPSTDKWNSGHFLDLAEMSAALAIAYDWLYNAWSSDQRGQILNALNTFGLNYGAAAYTDPSVTYAWWKTNTDGNWNCVCNSGIVLAALAVLGDDTTGNAQTILSLSNAINSAKTNCAQAVSIDGTWAETANYWYFGTTGHAEMASALMTATGSDYGLLTGTKDSPSANANLFKTGDFHMSVFGMTSLFNYGDHGPNKFSTTANSMMLYGQVLNQPRYQLFQRDQADAAEPWSMFWYDPSVAGAYWDGRALDMNFDDSLDQWVAMRSSWTDQRGLYLAMKAGQTSGTAHQNHNDLDAGDFVLDALGTRWAGELGSGDYNAPNYFVGENQGDPRWTYYRKMTEGQNTILVNRANQLVTAKPTILGYGSSGTVQGDTTVVQVGEDDTAFWVADLSSAYSAQNVQSVKRGVRTLNGRRQVLIQDEIGGATTAWQWRMHTNATVSLSGTSALLSLDGETMKIDILSPPSGAVFSTSDAVRFDTDVTPPAPDQSNPGVTVLIVEVQPGSGTTTLEILFSPQWNDGGSEVGSGQVKSVALSDWTLTSHNN